MTSRTHWDQVYSSKTPTTVSWFQTHAQRSLRLIRDTGVPSTAAIIDVGGGASTLVDDLLAESHDNLTVLDLSASALAAAQRRLGAAGSAVRWIEADITDAHLAAHAYQVWHDRAVFHFLTSVEARRAYVQTMLGALAPGAHAIIATFAENGPTQCSGLPVQRYSAATLHAELGASFDLLGSERETHRTPLGAAQNFIYCHLRRTAEPAP